MAVGWTGLGPELLMGLDRSGGEPLGLQLQRQLRTAIREGRLEQGERLPSSRVLAGQLDVSRGLVVDTYAQLASEGYLSSEVGSGTRVALGTGEARAPVAPAAPARPSLDVEFEYGIPDLGGFPMRDWLWALQLGCRTASVADLGDEPGNGSERLRHVLAAYLRRVRGSSVDADGMVVCPGFRHGLNIVCRALAVSGLRTIAVEEPGPADHDVIAVRSGLDVVRAQVDERGIDVDELAATEARAVIVTPAHQSPTGVLLAPERRHALVEWARRVDGFIIEDDYDAEFRYDRQPVGSMQGLAPDRVIAMGSVSKTLAPTVRIGWIACPPDLGEAVAREKQLLGRGVPGIDQLALAALVESGRYDRHLRHMRGVYGRRRQVLVDTLAEHAPDIAVTGLAAGCHAVLRLPQGTDEGAVVSAARQRSIGVYPLGRYCARPHPPGLVIGFGNVTEQAIRRGIEAIADLLGAAPMVH
jgi:GntR family transcriptional regulator/MocR family aminotransferase